jgi:hypothetical protein
MTNMFRTAHRIELFFQSNDVETGSYILLRWKWTGPWRICPTTGNVYCSAMQMAEDLIYEPRGTRAFNSLWVPPYFITRHSSVLSSTVTVLSCVRYSAPVAIMGVKLGPLHERKNMACVCLKTECRCMEGIKGRRKLHSCKLRNAVSSLALIQYRTLISGIVRTAGIESHGSRGSSADEKLLPD